MPDLIVAETEGLKELQAAFRRAGRNAVKFLDRAITDSIHRIEQISVPITPIDTGFLRNSIVPQFYRGADGVEGFLVAYAPYALDVHREEFRPKNPNTVALFFDVGLDRAEGDIERYINEALDKISGEMAA